MKLILVVHRGNQFITNIPVEEVANVIQMAHDYADSVNGNWKDAVSYLRRRWIFEEARTVEVL